MSIGMKVIIVTIGRMLIPIILLIGIAASLRAIDKGAECPNCKYGELH
jgi:hypothetical protein